VDYANCEPALDKRPVLLDLQAASKLFRRKWGRQGCKVRSVVENVDVLKHAFEEHAIGQDPFGGAWQNIIIAYIKDIERRIYLLIFGNNWIGIFR